MKMEFKGTKGEWIVFGDIYPTIESKIKECGVLPTIANVNSTFREKEEALANAKLIASAPELLKALQEIIPIFEALVRESKQPTKADEYNCHKKAMKAIEKALKID